MKFSRQQLPYEVSVILDLPVRWVPTERLVGDYDGRERTLEVFNAEASEQRALLKRLRSNREQLEHIARGPLVIVFHTPKETARLYCNVVAELIAARDSYLAASFLDMLELNLSGEPAVEPDEVSPFTMEVAA